MVVTRQSTYRDAGETGEESHLESPPDTSPAPIFFQPPSTIVFQPPNQMNASDEFGKYCLKCCHFLMKLSSVTKENAEFAVFIFVCE